MEKNYSPFPAVAAALAGLLLYFSFDLFVSLRQRSVQQKQLAALEKIYPEAQKINQSMIGLSRDLIATAPKSTGAKKIVEDFKIQAIRPPTPDENPQP